LAFSELPEQRGYGASSSRPQGDDPCWSKIWSSFVPPKVKTFAWKVASNALATESNKKRRKMNVTGVCNICNLEAEDTLHALTRCPHAFYLWEAMRECWHIPSKIDFQSSSIGWFRELILTLPKQMIDCTLLVAWRIWYARNEVTHDKPLPSTEGSKRFLISYISTLRDIKTTPTDQILKGKRSVVLTGAHTSLDAGKEKPPDKPWLKPPAGWVKLTIDGSFRTEDGTAGVGMVLRDEVGTVIFSACRFLPSCAEAFEAELLACSEGLSLALQYSQLPIIVDSDCARLVAVIQEATQDRSPFLHIIF
jgi:hypothetical protein